MASTRGALADVSHGIWLRNTGDVEPRRVVEWAEAAEDAGWDGVFCSDSLTWNYTDPWPILSATAARTERVTLGTWITPIPRRQPWQLAYELATLDRIADGRVLLGGGLGTPSEHERFGRTGVTNRMGAKYDEALELIDQFWRGETVNHEGEHFTVDEFELPVTPVQSPRIPVVLGGWWPNEAPFRRAAKWDGVMPYWPAIGGDGPQGETASGTIEEELRELMAFYHSQTDDPGEIVLPADPDGAPANYLETCLEVGATWLLWSDPIDIEAPADTLRAIRDGAAV